MAGTKKKTSKLEIEISKPEVKTSKPEIETSKPEVKTSKPEIETSKPEVKTSKPKIETSKLEVKTSKPKVKTSKPEIETSKPEIETSKPEIETSKPEIETSKPEIENSKPEVKISENIQPEPINKILAENFTEFIFNITDNKDFSPIFKYLVSNNFVSEEMQKIIKEIQEIIESKIINFVVMDILIGRLIRYYKLNVATLALYHYNDKVRGDIENINRILKAFMNKNKRLVFENTKHVIFEKKLVTCEFNTIVTAENLEIFDIFEKVSLNNLEAVLPEAKTIFTDIYTSWILIIILAIALDKTDYVVKKDTKKSYVDVLREKISLLNTDLTNPKMKSLINVAKKSKVGIMKPKKDQEIISEEDKKNIAKMYLKDKKISSKKQISIDISNAENDIKADLGEEDLDEADVIKEGDLEI